MKKGIVLIFTIFSIAIMASIGINFNISQETTTLSMKNIEAMARGEVDINPNTMYNHKLTQGKDSRGNAKACCVATPAESCNPKLQVNCN
ncbi:NVEALA domain-containing protein [Odoribacter sp. AF15-53]|uniref:NVEALA domain-containing protein n=1 Tax=Odoribacter sp. AF15-53 TaxID=2292236 RepID=UPI000E4D1124|nr:NVEALA domain-containing protein [Odoribacter sp. AF15-53]RHR82814.1 hypothetical protein DWW52_02830 [Odoribacter sp. AF15-53]